MAIRYNHCKTLKSASISISGHDLCLPSLPTARQSVIFDDLHLEQ